MLDEGRRRKKTGEDQDLDYWEKRESKIECIQSGIQDRINVLEKKYFLTFMDRVKGLIDESEYISVKKNIRKKVTFYEKKLKIMNSELRKCQEKRL